MAKKLNKVVWNKPFYPYLTKYFMSSYYLNYPYRSWWPGYFYWSPYSYYWNFYWGYGYGCWTCFYYPYYAPMFGYYDGFVYGFDDVLAVE